MNKPSSAEALLKESANQPSDVLTKQCEDSFRELPQNQEAEQALLGMVLINNRVYERLSEFLLPQHFANQVHGQVFEACGRLIERGHLADPTTLKSYFEQNELLKEVGGQEYLVRLSNTSITSRTAEEYGRLIHDRALRRELISVGQEMIGDAVEDDLDTKAVDQIENTEKKLYELATQGTRSGPKEFSIALTDAINQTAAAYKNEGNLAGLSSGFVDLDRKLGGLSKSDLLIIAGRPGMGKTALVTNVAFNVADIIKNQKDDDKSSVLFFSLEMSADQLAARILSTQTQISSHRMRTGSIEPEEFTRLAGAVRELEKEPLYIDDTPGLTVSNIRTRARRLKREKGLGLIIIDYIQLLSTPPGQNNQNRVQVVSEMTRGLKILAKELDVPVIALSQLSRSLESRDDKRPLLSDLRESGSIEQDADIVMFVYREFYYKERETLIQKFNESAEQFLERQRRHEDDVEALRNKSEVIIAKQRHGPTGVVDMYFNGEFTQFGDWINDDHMPEIH
ncbi:MAG: replicative DNA helicase [Alphaproteobacteria bacterium]|nr:replicative DNA helicase [Alphaproteobacteria bacterium]